MHAGAVVGIFWAFALQPVTALDDALGHARALSEEGRSGEAIREFEAIVAENPRSAPALAGLAGAYAIVDDPRAGETFERALSLAPDDENVRAIYIDYLWKKRQTDKSDREMDRLLAAAVDKTKLRRFFGLKLYVQGRFPQAAEQLALAKAGGLDDKDLCFALGASEYQTGQFAAAETDLRRAAELAPGDAQARHLLGKVLLLEGRPAEAYPELAAAARLEPRSADILLDLGNACRGTNRPAEAEAAFRGAVEAGPDLGRTHSALASLLSSQGKREEAQKEAALSREAFGREQKAIQEAENRLEQLVLGRQALAERHPEKALPFFEKYPEDVDALRGAAEALSALNRHAEAARTLEHALKLAPGDPRIRYALDRESGQNR